MILFEVDKLYFIIVVCKAKWLMVWSITSLERKLNEFSADTLFRPRSPEHSSFYTVLKQERISSSISPKPLYLFVFVLIFSFYIDNIHIWVNTPLSLLTNYNKNIIFFISPVPIVIMLCCASSHWIILNNWSRQMEERKIITERGSGSAVFISFLKPNEIAYWKTLNLIDQ